MAERGDMTELDGLDEQQVMELCLRLFRARGRRVVRKRLEACVNGDLITLSGAQKVYHDAFGDGLIGVKVKKEHPVKRLLRGLFESGSSTETSNG